MRSVIVVTLVVVFAIASPSAIGVTLLLDITLSPDISVSFDGVVIHDEMAVTDDLSGALSPVSFGPVPKAADLDGLHYDGGNRWLLSFDVSVALDGVNAFPSDVVEWNGRDHNVIFDSGAEGLPAGTNIDAVARVGGDLVLSFDTTVAVNGMVVGDEDLVRFSSGVFGLLFDGSVARVPETADLDAAHVLGNGHLLVSFDIAGRVDDIRFVGADVLEYDPTSGTWAMAYPASAEPAWLVAELDAVTARADSDGDGVVDGEDNCSNADNADQRDTDSDNIGNACDPDFDDDCTINFIDLGFMKSVFFSDDADADLNGDGAVNFLDLAIMKALFFGPPGPSGLLNACGSS